jgi:pimeloyl-ACP methyl ester carboxylesterase
MTKGKFVTLNVSGERVETHYHELGPANATYVLLAQTGGAGTTAHMCWYLNMEALADAGFRVCAPDFVGYGYTKRAAENDDRINTTEFLSAFMDGLRIDRAHFVGNSMGSNAATKFAIQHPERVKSLVLTGGEPRVDSETSGAIAKDLGKTARTDFVKEMLSKSHVTIEDMRQATADFFYDSTHSRIDEITAMRLEIINRPKMREKAREHALRQTARGRSNFQAAELKKLSVPTYLIHGRDEKSFYSEAVAAELRRAAIEAAMVIPNCRLTLLPRCGHWPQIENAIAFNALLIQFLKEVDGSGSVAAKEKG